MSLHDIDKGGSKRSKPKPNSSDSVVDRLAHGTTQLQHSIDEAESDGLLIRERQILAVQDGFEKAVMGFYGTENKFGLKVAEDGVNVTEATDDQLIFNSEQNVFKVLASGTHEYTIPNGGAPNYTTSTGSFSTPVSFENPSGERPGVIAFFSFPIEVSSGSGYILFTGKAQGMPYLASSSTDPYFNVFFGVEAEELTFYFNSYLAFSPAVPPVVTFTYFVLQETIT